MDNLNQNKRIEPPKYCFILGTRPEIIKLSSIIKICQKENISFLIIHSGQHYSYNMDKLFFEELELPPPKYNLNIKSRTPKHQGEHTGNMLIEIEKILLKECPSIVFVQGDTNTVLAGVLAASKLNIPIAHVEAGLRSYDNSMPEEVNRKLADHLSSYLFVPTEIEKDILIDERIEDDKIFVTGNTIVDATLHFSETSTKKQNILEKLKVSPKNYFLVTAHRQENVDVKEKFEGIIDGLKLVYDKYKMNILYIIHPRAFKMLNYFNIQPPSCIRMIEPVGYLEFLQLEKNAKLILTDSGGLQEEACILGVPCVTLRENTERPQTIEFGINILAGTNAKQILVCVDKMLALSEEHFISKKNIFGDGKTGEKIVFIVKEKLMNLK